MQYNRQTAVEWKSACTEMMFTKWSKADIKRISQCSYILYCCHDIWDLSVLNSPSDLNVHYVH